MIYISIIYTDELFSHVGLVEEIASFVVVVGSVFRAGMHI